MSSLLEECREWMVKVLPENSLLRERESLIIRIDAALASGHSLANNGDPARCQTCGHSYYADDTEVEQLKARLEDAERYRKLKSAMTVPYAMQSFIKHMNWHPDTFKMGIDEAIDAAAISRAAEAKV